MKGRSHPTGKSSRASGISADGNTIVGFSEDPIRGYRRPVRWIAGKAEWFAGAHAIGEASAVSFDGSQIVGQYTTSANGIFAFYYSQQHGLVSLGTVSGIATDQSFANGVASNGMTVGWSGDPFGSGIQAFVWTAKLTSRSLTKYLKNHGAKIPSNILPHDRARHLCGRINHCWSVAGRKLTSRGMDRSPQVTGCDLAEGLDRPIDHGRSSA
jgi:hypothetical protein